MFPFVPFLVGAAAGAAIMYVAKDRGVREKLRQGADGLRDGVDRTARAVKALAGAGSGSHRKDDEG